ncbi:MAG: hypothetical protein WBG38_20310 [Nodosilinea sp.]
MTNFKVLGALATTMMLAGAAGPAAAQQVSTSAGFTLSDTGSVTSVVFSSAVSDNFAFSSATSNTGGVYTEAFSTVQQGLGNTGLLSPSAVENGDAVTTVGGSEVLIFSDPIGFALFGEPIDK